MVLHDWADCESRRTRFKILWLCRLRQSRNLERCIFRLLRDTGQFDYFAETQNCANNLRSVLNGNIDWGLDVCQDQRRRICFEAVDFDH